MHLRSVASSTLPREDDEARSDEKSHCGGFPHRAGCNGASVASRETPCGSF